MPVDEASVRFLGEMAACVKCLVNERLQVASNPVSRQLKTVGLAQPAPLRAIGGGRRGLLIDLDVGFASVAGLPDDAGARAPFVVVTSYQYRLLDRNERELLAWHWHPGHAFRGPDYPHLHVAATVSAQLDAVRVDPIRLHAKHLPTGAVTLPAFARMAIEEFGAAPLAPRWREAIDRAERLAGAAWHAPAAVAGES